MAQRILASNGNSPCSHDLSRLMEPVHIFGFIFCPVPTSLCVITNISPHFAYFVFVYVSDITAAFTNFHSVRRLFTPTYAHNKIMLSINMNSPTCSSVKSLSSGRHQSKRTYNINISILRAQS